MSSSILKKSKIFSIILLVFVASTHSLFALQIHVALHGKDTNVGTRDHPLLSIPAAQEMLRNSGRLGKEPCTVIIYQGVYRVSKPIQLEPKDSGSMLFPVIYTAADNEEVIITGAQLVNTNWSAWKNGIFRTRVDYNYPIDQVFINNKRQVLARFPNEGAGFVPSGLDNSVRGKKAGTPPFNGCTPNAWDAEKVAQWKNPVGAFMHGMHGGLWGSQHYMVTGVSDAGELMYEGGWQNNRSASPHRGYRMIENIFEELDVPGEWFHDKREGWLYYKPKSEVNLNEAITEVVLNTKHLIEVYGANVQPPAIMSIPNSGNGLEVTTVKNYQTTKAVRHIQIKGIRFSGTARTFMQTKEPLLRSDWSVYRGGAIHLRGTKDVQIIDCEFTALGGNAIFVDGFNRNTKIRQNYFQNNGATDINFVGSFATVRNPAFNYRTLAKPLDEIDTEIGPKTDEYPADALVEDNVLTRCGRYEKQSAGINISMSARITIRHNTISHTPRAAINICDGTWGGHIIEWNDCFETVLETDDHGAFNSWGRDRYWFRCGPSGPDLKDKNGQPIISKYIKEYPEAPFWDAYQTTILRNNRMQCDHGWDIDLDDGSTNYEIYNNLCLSGGLKTREGYKRIVTNNIILGRGYTCNVPYPGPTQDVFEHNILWGRTVYRSSKPLLWSGVRDYNFVHNPDVLKTVPAFGIQQQTNDDKNSLYGNAAFIAPAEGDFYLEADSPAVNVGFTNFPMAGFGVMSRKLKKLVGSPPMHLPKEVAGNIFVKVKTKKFMGAKIKTVTTDAEVTATGLFDKSGVLLVAVPKDSELGKWGFRVDDVVMEIDGTKIVNESMLIEKIENFGKGTHKAKLWRNQESYVLTF